MSDDDIMRSRHVSMVWNGVIACDSDNEWRFYVVFVVIGENGEPMEKSCNLLIHRYNFCQETTCTTFFKNLRQKRKAWFIIKFTKTLIKAIKECLSGASFISFLFVTFWNYEETQQSLNASSIAKRSLTRENRWRLFVPMDNYELLTSLNVL